MKRTNVGCSLIFLAIIVLGVPAFFFAQRAGNAAQTAAASSDLEYYVVQQGDVEVAVSGIGRVESDQRANLSFSGAGTVAEILVTPGTAVSAGTVLARLDNDAQRIAVDQATLAAEAARVRLQDILAGPDAGQIAVAQANVDAARGAYNASFQNASADDIRAAELAYEQALARLAAAEEARRTAPGGQPEQSYQLLEAAIGEASFNAEIARLQVEQVRTGSGAQQGSAFARLEQAQAELEQLMAGPQQAQIDSANIAIAQAEAALERAQSALDDTLLTAPFDGVIGSISIEVGALVTPTLPVGEIYDVEPLRVEVKVDEIDVREISEGMSATVTFDALENVLLPVTIEQIALVGVSENGIISYPVTLRLESADPRVRVGMTAEASFVVEAVRGVLIVPNQYVRLDRQDNRAFVEIVNAQGALEEIEVTLGLQGDDFSEVTAGLTLGDALAVDLGGDDINAFGG
jgi:HlyD family secretion protein